MGFEKPKRKNSERPFPEKRKRKPKNRNNLYLIASAVGIVVMLVVALLLVMVQKRNSVVDSALLPTLAVASTSTADVVSGRATLPPTWTPTSIPLASPTASMTAIAPSAPPPDDLQDGTSIPPLMPASASTGRQIIVDVDKLPLRARPDTSEQVIEYALRGAIRTILTEVKDDQTQEVWWYVADGYGWVPSQLDGKPTTRDYTPQALNEMLAETQQHITSDQNNYVLYLQHGWMLYGQHSMNAAIVELNVAIDKAEQQGVDDLRLYEYRGKIYLDMHDFSNALGDFDQAILMGLEEASAYNRRALAEKGLGITAFARDDYNKAIQLNLKYGLVYSNLGALVASDNQYDESPVDYYTQAIAADPYYPYAYSNRATYYRTHGDYGDHVIEDYTTAFSLLPNDLEILNNRGITYSNRGDYALAEKDYKQAIQQDPTFGKPYFNLGIDSSKMGDDKAALQYLLTALQMNMDYPFEALAYYRLGTVLQENGQYEAAYYAYNRAVEIDSRRNDALSALEQVAELLDGADENIITAYPNLEMLITPIP